MIVIYPIDQAVKALGITIGMIVCIIQIPQWGWLPCIFYGVTYILFFSLMRFNHTIKDATDVYISMTMGIAMQFMLQIILAIASTVALSYTYGWKGAIGMIVLYLVTKGT